MHYQPSASKSFKNLIKRNCQTFDNFIKKLKEFFKIENNFKAKTENFEFFRKYLYNSCSYMLYKFITLKHFLLSCQIPKTLKNLLVKT